MGRHDSLLPADYVHHLPQQDITIAEALQDHGYTTFFAGKWHLGDEGAYPEDHGFPINKGGRDKGSPMGGYFSPFENPKLEDRHDGENLSERLAKETNDFIATHQDSSFFCLPVLLCGSRTHTDHTGKMGEISGKGHRKWYCGQRVYHGKKIAYPHYAG